MNQAIPISSPIPPFNSSGLLPPFLGVDETTTQRSPYYATITNFVQRFAYSKERAKVLHGLLQYRSMLASLGYVRGYQYLNGSFVQDIENIEQRPPNDIDVFSVLYRPDKYVNNTPLWRSTGFDEWCDEIINFELNKKRFSVDTYGFTDDEFVLETIMVYTTYWYSLFSHRKRTLEWKGFVVVPLSPQEDSVAASQLALKESEWAEGERSEQDA